MNVAASVIRLIYGFLWLWAGVAKFKDPTAFSLAIRNYELIRDPLIAAVALFLPPLEVLAALAIIFRRWAAGALGLLWISLVVFTAAIVISWARGLDIECGCFGIGDTVNYPLKITQNLILLAAGGWLWWVEARRTSQVPDAAASP